VWYSRLEFPRHISVAPKRNSGFQISWTTITYRSVLLWILTLLAIIAFGLYVVFPEPSKKAVNSVTSLITKLLEKTGLYSAGAGKGQDGPQQANFTNIDGTVRVKKINSNTWINADYSTPLEKGDVVQTSSEGMAKIVFADGTNYTIKQDSLIVVEENSSNASQTSVSVQVTTGTVDLTTGTYSQGSKSQVVVAGATASVAPESSAQVRNDPRADQHEILVKKGSAQVARGSEVVRLADYEKVTFSAGEGKLAKAKVVGPPVLISPANMAPIFVTNRESTIQFSWSPVSNTSGYRLRVSKNPYFSSTVFDQQVERTDVMVPSLPEGAFYWLVQSLDGDGKESVESEKNRFTIIPKGKDKVVLALELSPFVQHGHVIEVKGKTEPTARVMVNGQDVPGPNSDGSFHYFTPPLPNGENVITVTAQNSKGAVNTQQKKVVIQ
jgi:hypothetical protein